MGHISLRKHSTESKNHTFCNSLQAECLKEEEGMIKVNSSPFK